jgi:large subunit ribosomal protein L4e
MRCKNSKVLRPGRGKARNRRYTMRRGPLFVVHDRNCKVALALRNLAGVDVAVASALDLR